MCYFTIFLSYRIAKNWQLKKAALCIYLSIFFEKYFDLATLPFKKIPFSLVFVVGFHVFFFSLAQQVQGV